MVQLKYERGKFYDFYEYRTKLKVMCIRGFVFARVDIGLYVCSFLEIVFDENHISRVKSYKFYNSDHAYAKLFSQRFTLIKTLYFYPMYIIFIKSFQTSIKKIRQFSLWMKSYYHSSNLIASISLNWIELSSIFCIMTTTFLFSFVMSILINLCDAALL